MTPTLTSKSNDKKNLVKCLEIGYKRSLAFWVKKNQQQKTTACGVKISQGFVSFTHDFGKRIMWD